LASGIQSGRSPASRAVVPEPLAARTIGAVARDAQQDVPAVRGEGQVLDRAVDRIRRALTAVGERPDPQLEVAGPGGIGQVGEQRPVRREPRMALLAWPVGQDRGGTGLGEADPRRAQPGQLGVDRSRERDRRAVRPGIRVGRAAWPAEGRLVQPAEMIFDYRVQLRAAQIAPTEIDPHVSHNLTLNTTSD
jgi:hypothetical protein